MDYIDKKNHWEKIYQTKDLKDVSWYQPTPSTSLNFLKQFNISKSAKIIDIGGGDSFLVDNLLRLGYQDITVLDISGFSLDRAKKRLGDQANKVKWVVADVTTFKPSEKYDFWHDRAAFHFLTQKLEIKKYIDLVEENIRPLGIIILGTFSEEGPKKCSGIDIKQYSEKSMTDLLNKNFEKIKCITVDHSTPFKTIQNFIFCAFRKLETTKV